MSGFFFDAAIFLWTALFERRPDSDAAVATRRNTGRTHSNRASSALAGGSYFVQVDGNVNSIAGHTDRRVWKNNFRQ
jgi:hypothetical protein